MSRWTSFLFCSLSLAATDTRSAPERQQQLCVSERWMWDVQPPLADIIHLDTHTSSRTLTGHVQEVMQSVLVFSDPSCLLPLPKRLCFHPVRLFAVLFDSCQKNYWTNFPRNSVEGWDMSQETTRYIFWTKERIQGFSFSLSLTLRDASFGIFTDFYTQISMSVSNLVQLDWIKSDCLAQTVLVCGLKPCPGAGGSGRQITEPVCSHMI